MKQLVILSGKGGTGETSPAAAFAHLAHDVSQRIEKAIRAEVPHVERALIHYEPAVPRLRCYAFPLATPAGILSEHFGEAPYFALVGLKLSDGEVEEQVIIQNPFREISKAKGIRVDEWLISQKMDWVMLKEVLQGKGPGYVFADSGAEIIYTNAGSVSSALDEMDG